MDWKGISSLGVKDGLKKHTKLAFCVPTYNRSLMVDEFLGQFALLFHQLKIDIHYYDSSEGMETESVVRRWIGLYGNIHYSRISSDWHANYKVLDIYRQHSSNTQYGYIWVCGDAIRCSEKILAQIMAVLDSGYDMVVINGIDSGRIGTREYVDGNSLFQDCAWHMTLFGAVIVNMCTVLGNVPWSYIQERYGIPERINYSHVGLYFESICRMDKFRAFYIAADQEIWGSQLKQKAGWHQDAFVLLCEYWPSTIEALPGCYTNKQEAINKLGHCSCLTPTHLLRYRLDHVYNVGVFLKYKERLRGMSRLNVFQLWGLAILDPVLGYYIAVNDLKGYFVEIGKVRRLRNFCRRKKSIYIYGAGAVAKRYAGYMQREGIDCQGFLVTEGGQGPDGLLGRPVIPLAEFGPLNSGVGLVLALNQQNMAEVQPVLIGRGLWENSFHEHIMPAMLESWKKQKTDRRGKDAGVGDSPRL